jgi:hypothetical protein
MLLCFVPVAVGFNVLTSKPIWLYNVSNPNYVILLFSLKLFINIFKNRQVRNVNIGNYGIVDK